MHRNIFEKINSNNVIRIIQGTIELRYDQFGEY